MSLFAFYFIALKSNMDLNSNREKKYYQSIKVINIEKKQKRRQLNLSLKLENDIEKIR